MPTVATQFVTATQPYKPLFEKSTSASPFLKWVGGKSQLLNELQKYIPQSYNKYIEPFVGGGALFFNLSPETAIINDSNEELINAYKVVRDDVGSLIELLRTYDYEKDFYYQMRAKSPQGLSKIERAARLIYLNKTCFNGLYRVNKKNEFNVPMGRYSNPTICDEDKLIAASKALQNTVIECADYKEVLTEYASRGDLVYIDPPYHPISNYSDFKRYTKEFFYQEDQVILRDFIRELKAKGCFVIASNSHCDFILDLYKDFDIKVVSAKRYINKIAERRNNINEVIIL